MKQSKVNSKESRLLQSCNNSILQTTTNYKGNFSFPQGLLESSMNKYERQIKQKLQLSSIIDQIANTIHDIIDKLLHEKIYSQITRIINEVLCIRQQVSNFSRQESMKQEQINQQFKIQLKKLKRKIDEINKKNNQINFQSIVNSNQIIKNKTNISSQYTNGIEDIVKDVYQFMQKNEATKLFRECQQKIQLIKNSFQQSYTKLSLNIQDIKKKQKPINENLRKQLNDAISKDIINKQIKKCIKQNIKYLFDEIIRSRKDINQFKEQLNKINQRQRQLQFNYTLLQHKII